MSVIDVKVMFNLQTSTTMKLLPLVCLCLLTWSGGTFGDQHEVITVEEGSDVILPCSLSTSENIELKLFDWKKDGQKEVFYHDSGIHSNNGPSGQDEQFTGRVSHFPDELEHGNASIIIRNTKVADSGDYTCDFPLLPTERKVHIQLVVGAALKPYVTILDQTKDWVLLQCFVRGASPKPQLQWQDSAGNILPAEETQVSERGGSYDVILQATVTKTDNYRCVATQEEIKHQIDAEIHVVINEVITVGEGSDVTLPCSLSTSENIELELFDWKKDGQKRVFLYNSGIHSINSPSGQDVQFTGRVSHFPDELKHGNASIIIRNTKVADSGDYTCGFPVLQPERKIFHIQLVVGAAPKPYVTALNQTEDGVLLQCEVRGASPKPQLQWQDSAGNILPAKEPQVSERGGSYNVILQATVTKTDNYRCVATQEEINHQTHAEIYAVNESSTESSTGWIVAAVLGILLVGVILAVLYDKGVIKLNCMTDSSRDKSDQTAGKEMEPLSKSCPVV